MLWRRNWCQLAVSPGGTRALIGLVERDERILDAAQREVECGTRHRADEQADLGEQRVGACTEHVDVRHHCGAAGRAGGDGGADRSHFARPQEAPAQNGDAQVAQKGEAWVVEAVWAARFDKQRFEFADDRAVGGEPALRECDVARVAGERKLAARAFPCGGRAFDRRGNAHAQFGPERCEVAGNLVEERAAGAVASLEFRHVGAVSRPRPGEIGHREAAHHAEIGDRLDDVLGNAVGDLDFARARVVLDGENGLKNEEGGEQAADQHERHADRAPCRHAAGFRRFLRHRRSFYVPSCRPGNGQPIGRTGAKLPDR